MPRELFTDCCDLGVLSHRNFSPRCLLRDGRDFFLQVSSFLPRTKRISGVLPKSSDVSLGFTCWVSSVAPKMVLLELLVCLSRPYRAPVTEYSVQRGQCITVQEFY